MKLISVLVASLTMINNLWSIDVLPQSMKDYFLCIAVDQNNNGRIRKMLDRGANPNARCGNMIQSVPLHIAAGMGNTEALALLLAKGAQVDATDATGATAVHHAILGSRTGDRGTLEAVLKAGANPNQKDKHGLMALDEAVLNCQRDLVELLLQYGLQATPEQLDMSHCTAESKKRLK